MFVQILLGNALYSRKNYTAGKKFTRPPTNFNSDYHHTALNEVSDLVLGGWEAVFMAIRCSAATPC